MCCAIRICTNTSTHTSVCVCLPCSTKVRSHYYSCSAARSRNGSNSWPLHFFFAACASIRIYNMYPILKSENFISVFIPNSSIVKRTVFVRHRQRPRTQRAAFCKSSLSHLQLPYIRATHKLDFFMLFLALWMDILTLICACGALARTMSVCLDSMTGGMARIFILGRNAPINEPWPDVIGFSIIFLVSIMFMLGLEVRHASTGPVTLTVYVYFPFFSLFAELKDIHRHFGGQCDRGDGHFGGNRINSRLSEYMANTAMATEVLLRRK